jgi:hypothetical protein
MSNTKRYHGIFILKMQTCEFRKNFIIFHCKWLITNAHTKRIELWRALLWHATHCCKVLDKGYKFALDLISIRGLHTKLWAPKSRKSQLWEFRDSHLGVMGQNVIWVLVPWLDTEYTIRGKVIASPKSGSWWVLWVWVCSWLVLIPKVPQLHTNQLVLWFV